MCSSSSPKIKQLYNAKLLKQNVDDSNMILHRGEKKEYFEREMWGILYFRCISRNLSSLKL